MLESWTKTSIVANIVETRKPSLEVAPTTLATFQPTAAVIYSFKFCSAFLNYSFLIRATVCLIFLQNSRGLISIHHQHTLHYWSGAWLIFMSARLFCRRILRLCIPADSCWVVVSCRDRDRELWPWPWPWSLTRICQGEPAWYIIILFKGHLVNFNGTHRQAHHVGPNALAGPWKLSVTSELNLYYTAHARTARVIEDLCVCTSVCPSVALTNRRQNVWSSSSEISRAWWRRRYKWDRFM